MLSIALPLSAAIELLLTAFSIPYAQVSIPAGAQERAPVLCQNHVGDEVLVLFQLVTAPPLSQIPDLDYTVIVPARLGE